ncbi:MAG: thioredoxin family protein [Spirochaetota bacterium]
MKRRSVLVALFIASSIYANGISWHTDASKALAEAAKKNTIVMIDAYTDWCGWCKELDKKTYTDAKVIALAKEFVSLKVNPEKGGKNADFLSRYRVEGFPTILFVDAHGALIYVIGGFAGPKEFATKMADVLTIQERYLALAQSYAKGDRKDAAEYLDMLVSRGDITKALSVFNVLSGANVIAKEKRGTYYIAFGSHFGEAKEYAMALPWFEKAEKEYPRTDVGYQGIFFRAITLGNMKKIKECDALLSKVISDKGTSKEWRTRFEGLLKEGQR